MGAGGLAPRNQHGGSPLIMSAAWQTKKIVATEDKAVFITGNGTEAAEKIGRERID